MFSGIVEECGRLVRLEERAAAWRLEIEADTVARGTAMGDSIAVNGCCLTVVDCGGGRRLGFDLLVETLRLTNLGSIAPGGRINLERSIRADGRLGGHFVSGHVDCTGTVEVFEPRGADRYLRVAVPEPFMRHIVHKGSIAIDGVSLTVAEAGPSGVAIWLIPHTCEITRLGDLKAGDRVNIETDLLAKYVENLLARK